MSSIRSLRAEDHDDWQVLWRDYLTFYREDLGPQIFASTFARLCAGEEMFGLIALDDRGRGIGLAHCVLHATTWSRRPTCYLEDLFIAGSARGQDLGRSLLLAVKHAAEQRGAQGVYWHTQVYNGPARSLYDAVGRPTSHVVYEM